MSQKIPNILLRGKIGVGDHHTRRADVNPMSYMFAGIGLLFVLFAVLGAIFS